MSEPESSEREAAVRKSRDLLGGLTRNERWAAILALRSVAHYLGLPALYQELDQELKALTGGDQ